VKYSGSSVSWCTKTRKLTISENKKNPISIVQCRMLDLGVLSFTRCLYLCIILNSNKGFFKYHVPRLNSFGILLNVSNEPVFRRQLCFFHYLYKLCTDIVIIVIPISVCKEFVTHVLTDYQIGLRVRSKSSYSFGFGKF
jgi:hypothetical protein